MKTRVLGSLAVAAAILLGAAFSASALPDGRLVPASDAVVQFFVAHGIDAQYVGAPQSKVPQDVWMKMVALESDPQLSALVDFNLRQSMFYAGNKVYEQIGDLYYTAQRVNTASSPMVSMEAIG